MNLPIWAILLFQLSVPTMGKPHARPRTAPLPEEPLHALEALADHLMATTASASPDLVQRGKHVVNRTPFGKRTGWEQLLIDWLADLGERFGETATWLLGVLRMQVLQDQGFGQGWKARQRDAFQRNGGYALHAFWFWDIPDVELRAWFRRYIQAHPGSGEWFWKALILLGFHEGPQAGKALHAFPKSVILALLTRYPSPKDLYLFLHAHQHGFSLEPDPVTPDVTLVPSPEQPKRPSIESFHRENHTSAIFAIGSSHFVGNNPQPEGSRANFSPPAPELPDPVTAYQPVHDACVALLRAIQQLTTEYGQAWLQ